jgi:hypothetical protein
MKRVLPRYRAISKKVGLGVTRLPREVHFSVLDGPKFHVQSNSVFFTTEKQAIPDMV